MCLHLKAHWCAVEERLPLSPIHHFHHQPHPHPHLFSLLNEPGLLCFLCSLFRVTGWVTAEDEKGWGLWTGELLPLVWAWRAMMKTTWAMKKSSPTFCLPSSLETSTSVTKLPLKGAPPCYRTPMAGPIPLPSARDGAEGCWQRERGYPGFGDGCINRQRRWEVIPLAQRCDATAASHPAPRRQPAALVGAAKGTPGWARRLPSLQQGALRSYPQSWIGRSAAAGRGASAGEVRSGAKWPDGQSPASLLL